MRLNKMLAALMVFGSFAAFSCGQKDADIAADAQKVLPIEAKVDVKDGVATLTGQFKDESAKKAAEEVLAKIKGVKSVVNNATVTPPPPPPVTVVSAADELLAKGIKDATKDFPTVKAQVKDGIISLTGEIKKASLPKLMMVLNALKPKKIDNKLTVQ